MKIDICIDMILTEYDWHTRITKCAEMGINTIEFWDFKPHNLQILKSVLAEWDVTPLAFIGNWSPRNLPLIDQSKRKAVIQQLLEAVDFATQIEAKNIVVLPGFESAGFDREEMWKSCVQRLGEAADIVSGQGITLLLEVLNRTDHPGAFLYSIQDAIRMIKETGRDLKLMLDIFHQAKEEKDLVDTIKISAKYLGHIQIADIPDRHEPGTGRVDWKSVLNTLKEIRYNGYLGFEYTPSIKSEDSIRKSVNYLKRKLAI